MGVLLLSGFHFIFCLCFEIFIFMTAQPDKQLNHILILGKMLHSHPEYVRSVIFISLTVSSSPFSRLCRGIYGLIWKKKKGLKVSHNLPLFLNMFNFFSPFLLLFVFWSFKAGFGRGNGTVTFYFFVLKFLSLADCVHRVWIAGCSSGVLPASRPHIRVILGNLIQGWL